MQERTNRVNYRPEGWKQPKNLYCQAAGADAMLEGLWKMANESPTKTFTLDASEPIIY